MARKVVGHVGWNKGSAPFSGRSAGNRTMPLALLHQIMRYCNGQYVGSAEVVELEELEKALASPSLRVFGWKDIGLGEDRKIMSIST
jgi:hypothetical protein